MSAESLPDFFLRRTEELAQEFRATQFRIIVLGPGHAHSSFWKRQQIVTALRDDGFNEVFMPEELVRRPSPGLSLVEQEEVLLSPEVDFVLVLNTSEGPLAELSALYRWPSFTEKTCVLCPLSFLQEDTFPRAILEHYPHLVTFEDEDLKRCNLIADCLRKARALRLCKWNKLKPQQF